MRQDQKFEWYEVRSSMRLAWLKAKQMIIPVEVICSFQQMHTDCPAGSANGIVARLQRVSGASLRSSSAQVERGGGDRKRAVGKEGGMQQARENARGANRTQATRQRGVQGVRG